MKNKEAEFLEQIEQEKASVLALLQVERQVWEANRAQGLPGKHKETEWVRDECNHTGLLVTEKLTSGPCCSNSGWHYLLDESLSSG